ncbi:DNA-binding transcriptional response regulator, NtrC family, contains REC, AAA-type ATPase, and a Fis-type DNA-binding domains [Halopseudomonas xinjiangensis]|uniref:DNA-binding transcriptional response regulator, NtrC family, contains REC, AAA-type ATPase, and a Fis-type DNA-binding domains n=1 Tax=Halopseudomonas xinjiangensis TaxID=487184 RepID=A0A1H1MXW6_9GAMM|nr:sigma-54 dependent transcriptional regulator [Halopseudomonas xinjiangensis]SDR91520.1 DNA-binding transcriptional response regulator, NtrC family, contains REC, AAA-type ATPase, and a Fis-type DNA-binding domains [Halopseudomonas xinjiangensis]
MTDKEHIVLIEDDRGLRELLQEELEVEGYSVTVCGDAETGLLAIREHLPELVVSDLRLPGADGLSLLPAISQCSPKPSVLIITAFGSVQQAVESLKAGADDFLTKPLEMDHFLLTVSRLLDNRRLRSEVQRYRSILGVEQFHGIIGQSPAMQQLFHQIRQIAGADGPVLIQGESGTGKELVARAVHEQSSRKNRPYLVVNCGGIPGELMESEFFGHAAGAFTGARTQRAGLFQQADGGTLMLDELGEMPPPLQAKLLRALQDGHVRPVGSDHEIQVDVRVIAATNRNLTEAVNEGTFREDLYYRLETFGIQVPPLRSRREDIRPLAEFFLTRFNTRQGRNVRGFSDDTLALMADYGFPGNVRELQNAVERAATFCDTPLIEPRHLPERMLGAASSEPSATEQLPDAKTDPALAESLPDLETVHRNHIHRVLTATQGNKRKAADILGITRRTLYRWLE